MLLVWNRKKKSTMMQYDGHRAYGSLDAAYLSKLSHLGAALRHESLLLPENALQKIMEAVEHASAATEAEV